MCRNSLSQNKYFCEIDLLTAFPVNLVTFTEEILNGKLHFLCSGMGEKEEGDLEALKINPKKLMKFIVHIADVYSEPSRTSKMLFNWVLYMPL